MTMALQYDTMCRCESKGRKDGWPTSMANGGNYAAATRGSRPPQRLMKKETISFEQDFRSMSVFQQLASSPEF